jgi:hypothetical protein
MNRDELRKFFKDWYVGEFSEPNSSKLLQEQDDLFGGEEEEGAEEEAGDEAAEEDVAAEEEVEAVEVEKVAIEAGDEVRLGKQFDIALDSILADYEMNALKSAQIHVAATEDITATVDQSTNEWWNCGLDNLLFEQEEVEEAEVSENQLDIDLFSEDVARLINNYSVLMDMESIIFNKAKEMLIVKYGKEVAEAFAEILRIRHDMDFDSEIEELEDIEDAAPLAVGAGGGGGGGAA